MFNLVFLLLVTVACVTPRSVKTVYLNVDPEKVPILFNIFKNCAEELGLDSKILQKVINWKFENIESENKLIHCFTNTAGYCDDDGHLMKDKFLLLVGDHKSKDEFSKSVDECNKLKGSNKYDSTYEIVNCLRNTSPILFKL